MESQVLFTSDFSLKGFVLRIVWHSQLPENSELLDGGPGGLLPLQVFDDHVREDSWDEHVKLSQLVNDHLSVDLVVKNGPEILDNFFAMGVALHLTGVSLFRLLQEHLELSFERQRILEQLLVELPRLVERVSDQPLDLHY